MPATLRPSADAFRIAGWLPASPEIYNDFMTDLVGRTCNRTYASQVGLLPPIQDFQEFIENDATVYQEFIRMFEGVTESPTDYHEMLNMFNDIYRKAPFYGDIGPPLSMIMLRIINTEGGFSAFTKEHLNRHFKALFQTWATFLSSKDSRYVLVSTKFDEKHYGWFSPQARVGLMAQFNAGRTFEQVFLCDQDAPYHGFTSYEDFFVRKFRDVSIDRPIAGGVELETIVSAPCEAMSYNVQENVRLVDDLFIKDEAYSLKHVLNHDVLTEKFEGGKIVQGFLHTTGYHRWHSPVNGTIVKIIDVPGTYFAQAPSTIGDPINDTDVPPFLKSLRYLANVAARQIIFIEADNADIGLIFFISIGMAEISTCEATVYDGQHVQRGDELGMFHFGGSSFVLGFRKDSDSPVKIDGKYATPETPIKINDAIAAVNK